MGQRAAERQIPCVRNNQACTTQLSW